MLLAYGAGDVLHNGGFRKLGVLFLKSPNYSMSGSMCWPFMFRNADGSFCGDPRMSFSVAYVVKPRLSSMVRLGMASKDGCFTTGMS